MNDAATWPDHNSTQLSAAIQDIRQRLERYCELAKPGTPPRPAEAAAPPGQPRSFFQRLLGAPTDTAAGDGPRSAAPDGAAGSAAPGNAPAAIDVLCRQLGLSAFERKVLLLCAGVELDTRIASLCARAQDDPSKPYPTFALALSLFDDASWDVLSPERPLRYWKLVEIRQSGAQPLTTSGLRADERIVNYLKGLGYLDERVTAFTSPFDVEVTAAVAPSQAERVERVLRHLQHVASLGRIPVVQLLGVDSMSKQLVADHCADALRLRLCRLLADTLPPLAADLDALARLWQRESRLLPLALYLDADDVDMAAPERAALLARFASRIDGVTFLAVRDALPRLTRPLQTIDVAKPTAAEQRAAWQEALGPSADDAPAALAAQFSLNIPAIQRHAQLVALEASRDGGSAADQIWDVCCVSERPRLDALAQRLTPKAGWTDLVLPPAETALLHQIAAQVAQRNTVYRDWGFERRMNRGYGITALFAGDSGTGKTMAAEVIARSLRLDLYRIDLSAVVNKYIGETEKNLRRLFDAAEDAGAILFFDEADALFGKRSEVKDSHDRYANIEVSYLLQRMEQYRGLAILTSNMRNALDQAFLRRLRFIIEFPFPDAAQRAQIWRRVFPADVPLGTIDWARLAKLNVPGGAIRNIALSAAFIAADAGASVEMTHLARAARAEYRKLEKPLSDAELA